jgi:D-apiose dehydrogenase
MLRFAIAGTGFWSRFQLAGWKELGGVECAALYNRTRSKAEVLASEFGVTSVYDTVEALLDESKPDFLDIITDVGTHARLVRAAAQRRVSVICQKPMATSLAEAEEIVDICRETGTPLYIHENWRWQWPVRCLKQELQTGAIGTPFRATIQFCSSFPVFDNQPFLKELDQFILTDMGSHILDTARFLFGEAETLYCETRRVHADIRGEDVATVMLRMGPGVTVVCHLSYASRLEHERFPETFILVEGDSGSVELAPDYWIRTTTRQGTHSKRCPPPRYPWADPAYDLVHASIVACNANLLQALKGDGPAETTGADNLNTVRLVFAAYDSAKTGAVMRFTLDARARSEGSRAD